MRDTSAAIRAVVFDLDDTLYPEWQYVRGGYAAAEEHLRRRTGRALPLAAWLWSRFLGGLSANAFDAANAHFGLGLSKEGILELVSVYRRHEPDIRPYGGAVEALARLHAGYRLGLLTDGPAEAQRRKAEALKIGRFLDAMVLTGEVGPGASKPSTVAFEAAAGELGVPHAACAYVGDNPAKDFLAPNRLGWRTIQWLHPRQLYADAPAPEGGRPQYVVRLPGDLLAAIRQRA